MLKELCTLNSASGDEGSVREFIINQIKDCCDYNIDSLGSIIAFKKGAARPDKKVMLSAHMDEVGFIITDIDESGYLSFSPVGGIDPKVVANRTVTLNGIDGVIGLKPIHLLNDEEKKKAPDFKSMKIDIGAVSRENALEFVQPGDYAYFSSDFAEFGDGYIMSKALDDRIGCMILIDLIKSDLAYDTWFCFNVQEEVGLRGAACTSYQVKSDIAVVIEATTAADLCGVKGGDRVCVLGNGPVVSFMDGRTIYDKKLYSLAIKTAKHNNIKAQTKTAIAGGNDAGAIQTSAGGSRVLAVSLPCRYIHSGSSVVKKSDIAETQKLIKTLLPELNCDNND